MNVKLEKNRHFDSDFVNESQTLVSVKEMGWVLNQLLIFRIEIECACKVFDKRTQ